MSNTSWQQEHRSFNGRMSELKVTPTLSIAVPSGIGMIAHADFSPFEGDYAPAPYLMLNLCTAHIGRMRRAGEGPELEGVIRPGTVAIALPDTAASGYWSKTQMLGIAISPQAISNQIDSDWSTEHIVPAASRLHQDELLSSIMTALWKDAEIHSVSGAFFDHGIQVLLKRLESLSGTIETRRKVPALNGRKLQMVLDLIESRLEDDVRVTELAALAEQDSRTFTRAFTTATGFTPYAWLTRRRMELARQLLLAPSTSITNIALQIGYSNPSKFSAAFKRTFGITPSAWRKTEGLHSQ